VPNMVIKALPQSTIHLLGSAQALTTPTSLVKELIDNSIDAHATSVDVLISPNTLDKIEIRDNGHGISAEDLNVLGRRGHTSKLRTFEELKSIGRVSLGFRGEALASAVQLGDVSVTTRTDGEQVATLVKLKAQGGIASQTRTSHPVGTTVTVANFMFKIPVRKQKFTQNAVKTLAEIKLLLQAYSLARPHIRFGLKVTKGGKGSWTFAPRPNDGIKEAVAQVLGHNLVAQCVEKSLTIASHNPSSKGCLSLITLEKDQDPESESIFVAEAFLPKPDADPSKIGCGQFISIDSRPVAHDKGTMKKIVTMYKYYIKAALTDNCESVRSPFLRLNIKCPISSYDPNVEPAKDDVLFEDETIILDFVENLFRSFYGTRKEGASSAIVVHDNKAESLNSFNPWLAQTLLPKVRPSPEASIEALDGSVNDARKTGHESIPILSTKGQSDNERSGDEKGFTDPPLAGTKGKWDFNMCEDYSEDIERDAIPKKRIDDRVSQLPAMKLMTSDGLNPWLIAKINAQARGIRNETDAIFAGADLKVSYDPLPTPQNSSSPMSRANDGHRRLNEQSTPPHQTVESEGVRISNVPFSSGAPQNHKRVDRCQQYHQSLNQQTSIHEGLNNWPPRDDSKTYGCGNDFVSAGHALAQDIFLPNTTPNPQKQGDSNKEVKSSLRTVRNSLSSSELRQTILTEGYTSVQAGYQDCLQQESDEELAWAMDYEYRKENIARRRREECRGERPEGRVVIPNEHIRISPHKNRYTAAIATLESNTSTQGDRAVVKERFTTTLPDGDPRSYFMRRKFSMAAQVNNASGPFKPIRAKSIRLPLESIPSQQQLHKVLLRLPTNMSSLHGIFMTLAVDDDYVGRGRQTAGLKMTDLETTLVATRVEEIVNQWINADPNKDPEGVLYNFENMINV
jgi:DNA mismatch repair protein MutL